MIKIWGRANSSNVMKPLWVCDELGIAYDRADLGGSFGGNDDPAYRAMNPNGTIPTIDDDGFVLWESNAIVRYLCAKYGSGSLYPEDVQARADADRWMEWSHNIVGGLVPLFWQLIRTPPEKRDPDVIESSRKKTAALWQILDRHLAGRTWVTGDAFTMGDVPLGVLVHRWFGLEVERPPAPNLEAWYGRLSGRAPYKTHVMVALT